MLTQTDQGLSLGISLCQAPCYTQRVRKRMNINEIITMPFQPALLQRSSKSYLIYTEIPLT